MGVKVGVGLILKSYRVLSQFWFCKKVRSRKVCLILGLILIRRVGSVSGCLGLSSFESVDLKKCDRNL